MTFRTWILWFRGVPWVLRWFLILMLARPVLDPLYFLKDVSPILSPLYVIGIVTPMLIILVLLSRRLAPVRRTFADSAFWAWGALLGFNVMAVLTVGMSFPTVEVAVKLLSPFLIFLLARRLIRSKRDLIGVLTTFLYSTAFPFCMMFYEKVVSPVHGSLTLTRGFYRSSGLYADVMSYAIYFIGAFLVAGFLFLLEQGDSTLTRRTFRLFAVSTLSLIGLLHIHHTASYVVFFSLAALLAYHVLGRKGAGAGAVIVLVCLGTGIVLLAGHVIDERLAASFSPEIAVVEGDADTQHAFHGRMSRWTRYVYEWQDRSVVAKFLGVSTTSDRLEVGMVLGIHNDYLRILFASGCAGLACYIMFYLILFVYSRSRSKAADRFVIRGAIAIMLLYSMTSVVTIYFPLLYLTFSVFAYAALPAVEPVRARQMVPARRRLRSNQLAG